MRRMTVTIDIPQPPAKTPKGQIARPPKRKVVTSPTLIVCGEEEGLPAETVCHYCPACERLHALPGDRWQFNGDLGCPTFTPGVDIPASPFGITGRPERCHYQIVDGRVIFADDCTHNLRGRTVNLPPLAAQILKGIAIGTASEAEARDAA